MSRFKKANQWIALLTNVGVLAGLLALIYELRQNTISIENQVDVAIAEIGMNQANLFVADEQLAALSVRSAKVPWDGLSPVEQERMGIFWSLLLDRVALQQTLLHRSGSELTRKNIVFPERLIAQESFLTWWEGYRIDPTIAQELVDFFDAYINEVAGR